MMTPVVGLLLAGGVRQHPTPPVAMATMAMVMPTITGQRTTGGDAAAE